MFETDNCWEERTCAELIAKIKRSKYARECFHDARYFHRVEGYAMVNALKISWNHWGS